MILFKYKPLGAVQFPSTFDPFHTIVVWVLVHYFPTLYKFDHLLTLFELIETVVGLTAWLFEESLTWFPTMKIVLSAEMVKHGAAK